MNAARYSLAEAIVSLRRSGRSAAMSVGTIAIAFLALGGFVLVSANAQRVVQRAMDAAEMSVYLRENVTTEQLAVLETDVRARPQVSAVEVVSKERALTRFRADFPELADVASGLATNPFPASLEVRLRPGPGAAAEAEDLALDIGALESVADVQYDRRWLTRVLALVTGGRIVGLVVAGALMLGAAFTVAAVVRLSLHARRHELDIMQLVGAPLAFIRGPFVAEGLLLGGAGAAAAVALLWAGYWAVAGWLGPDLAGLLGGDALVFLSSLDVALLVLAGLAVGAAAGTVAARAIR